MSEGVEREEKKRKNKLIIHMEGGEQVMKRQKGFTKSKERKSELTSIKIISLLLL